MNRAKSLLLGIGIILMWLFTTCTRGDFVSTLITFNGINGGAPNGLLLGADGNFYGTTSTGGTSNLGTVFQLTTNGLLATLASFSGTNGAVPYAGLKQGADGNFYGTTYSGGASNLGTVFQMTTNGTLAALASFRTTNGSRPYAVLALGTNGNFYGTTVFGGANNAGTVFKINPTSGTLAVLHSFTGGNGGANPYAGLVIGTNGNFYGTTYGGGTNGLGTVFMISPDAANFKSWSFTLSNRGATPYAGLVLGTNGIFYGTTSAGGASNLGTVFMITHDFATSSVLHSFTRIGDDGAIPLTSLLQNYDGDFYGTTLLGGKYDSGTIFRFRVTTNPIPNFTNVYSFAGSIDGGNPQAQNPLTADGLRNIFGTASSGGTGQGTLFLLIQPPEFKSPRKTSGLFAADWSAQLGWTIKYQYRFSLDLIHWTNSGTAFSATNHTMTTSSPIGTTSRWFLDIQEIPPGIGLW